MQTPAQRNTKKKKSLQREKMILGHKSKDDVTEGYIRVAKGMRARFFEYVELIVGQKDVPLRLHLEKTG